VYAASIALLVLTGVATLYYILSAAALRAHFVGRAPNTQHPTPNTRRVSLLKPVCGVDRGSQASFETFLNQDYPDYEVIFGALDPDDPAIPIIRQIDAAELAIGSEIEGANNKVRILHNLARRATGEILVVSDADTRVTPDFLRRITAPFDDPGVGAVTCLYRGVEGRAIADALEGLHMTCVFAPGVACAERLNGIDFGLGAAIAVRRSVLDAIGGFEAIADHLADNFQLGRKVAEAGFRVALSDYVMEIVLGGEGLRPVLSRELRWCRTTRVSRPRGHFGLVVTFGFAYAVGFLLTSGFSALGWEVFAGLTLVRFATAFAGARALGDRKFARRAFLLPLRDLLSFGVWIAGYLSRKVTWRGRRLSVASDGRMVALPRG
jgi:ceramide glucosyltransferase